MSPPAELQKTVDEFVVVERPLITKRQDQISGYKVPHEGCVATTWDGQKYLIEKGVAPDEEVELHRIGGDKGSRIIKIGKELPLGFRVVKSVKVARQATLMELLEASGKDYDCMCRNCWNATESMKKIVTNEWHMPWQMKVGIVVGVVALALGLIFYLKRGGSKAPVKNILSKGLPLSSVKSPDDPLVQLASRCLKNIASAH